MAKSSPEKLAAALRANLRRRKGPKGLEGLRDDRAAERTPEQALADPPPDPVDKPVENSSKN
jgi:hypothetical protein